MVSLQLMRKGMQAEDYLGQVRSMKDRWGNSCFLGIDGPLVLGRTALCSRSGLF